MNRESPFIIEPYGGVGPLRFGMTAAEVEAVLGPPTRRVRNYLGEWKDVRVGVNTCYDRLGERLVEIQLAPPSQARLGDVDLLATADPFNVLKAHDSEPVLTAGGVAVFLELGIAVNVTDDSDGDPWRTIGVFVRGRWSSVVKRLRRSARETPEVFHK